MTEQGGTLATLAVHFVLLSLLAIGGVNSVVPEMHRKVVDGFRWMTDRQFADMFAIGQVAPGPNFIVVTLIGYHVAGLPGALVATAAMIGPSCILTYSAAGLWERFRHSRWRVTVQAGLVPVSVGLVAASALVLAQTAASSWVAVALTATTAAVSYFTRIHPLWMFGLAAVLGYAGLV